MIDNKLPIPGNIIVPGNITLSPQKQGQLLRQIQLEFSMARDNQLTRKNEWLMRLKLYNNQRRDKQNVGDNLMYTTMSTLMASLYSDRLNTTFRTPPGEGGDDFVENLNAMLLQDYQDMEKDILDYFWDWNTMFFGVGLAKWAGWDLNIKTPIFNIIDNFGFWWDPEGTSIHGLKGQGAVRFCGHEKRMTVAEMRSHPGYDQAVIDRLQTVGVDLSSFTDQARRMRQMAQGYSDYRHQDDKGLGDNEGLRMLEWYTMFEGERYLTEVDYRQGFLVRCQAVDFFPYIDRRMSPVEGQFEGVSVADLTEDKQRKRSVSMNIALRGLEAALFGQVAFDKNKVDSHDINLDINGKVPVDGSPQGSVMSMPQYQPNMALMNYLQQAMIQDSQKATAATDMQMGIGGQTGVRTAWAMNFLASKVDERYSLTVALFSWSEKALVRIWYYAYDKYFKDFDKKMVAVEGAFGARWRTLGRQHLISDVMPRIQVVSQAIKDSDNAKRLQLFAGFFQNMVLDPTADKRYGLKYFAKLVNIGPSEIDLFFPQTPDEIIAEDQNINLNDNKLAPVLPNDNHIVHIQVHLQGKPTSANIAHIKAHKEAIRLQKERPELFQQPQAPGMPGGTMGPGMEPQQNTPPTPAGMAGGAPSPSPQPAMPGARQLPTMSAGVVPSLAGSAAPRPNISR